MWFLNLLNSINMRDPVTATVYLTLLALAIGAPFFVILVVAKGYTRRHSTKFFLLAPLAEEFILRIIIFGYLLTIFQPLEAILISAAIYAIYSDIVYGPPFVSEALVTGILFGFAFLEIGLIPVAIAHFFYRLVFVVW